MRHKAEGSCCKAEVARGQEAAAVQQVGHYKLRQPDGEEEVQAKSQGRGGDGATTATGVMQQPAGKQGANGRGGRHSRGKREGRHQPTRGGRTRDGGGAR